jgi:hypothetical protein
MIETIKTIFMFLGLVIILPPVFFIKSIKFLRE